MKLYHFPRTRSARVFWAAHELGSTLDIEPVMLPEGAHKKPEYLAVNPHGWVPTVRDDERDVTMFESGAICLDLCERAGKLLPEAGTGARALCYQLAFYANATLDGITIPPFLEIQFKAEDQRDKELIDKCHKTWRGVVAPYLAGVLGEKEYFCGDAFSLADIMVGYDLFFAQQMELLAEQPTLQAYGQRVHSRDGFKQAFGL